MNQAFGLRGLLAWYVGGGGARVRCNAVAVRFHIGCVSVPNPFHIRYTPVTHPLWCWACTRFLALLEVGGSGPARGAMVETW